MGCNCGGSFKIQDDGAEEVPVVGDASYFWNGGVTSENALDAVTAPDGTKVWNAETQRTEEPV